MTARVKQLTACVKAVSSPDEGQLAAIRRYTLVDVPAEQLVVREFALAHNCVDRDNECFDEALLAQFAATLPGKGCFVKHPTSWDGDSGPAEGLVYTTRTETMTLEAARAFLREPKLSLPPDRTEVQVLMAGAYFVRTDQNGALLLKMDAGIAGYISIGFNTANPPVKVFDAEGHEVSVRRWQAPGEALEMSLVWLGAQPGARATKSAPSSEDHDMNLQEQLDAANGQIKTLTSERDQHKTATAQVDALKTALGEDGTLLEQPAQLGALVTAGKAHRKALIDALVAADRVAGDVGDDEAAVKSATADYEAMPTSALERLAKRATPQGTDGAPATFGIKGGDPNASRADATKVTGPFADNPLFGAQAKVA